MVTAKANCAMFFLLVQNCIRYNVGMVVCQSASANILNRCVMT